MLNLLASKIVPTKWKYKTIGHESFSDCMGEPFDQTGIRVIGQNLPLQFLYLHKKRGLPLLVWFHGAVDQEKTEIPHFVGVSLGARLNVNSLHIADPSMRVSPTLRSCWYVGTAGLDFQTQMVQLLSAIAKRTEAPRIVVFGSSGGGFPCLALAARLPNTVAIVNSPCTSLMEHPNPALVRNYEAHCLQGQAVESLRPERFICAKHDYRVLEGNTLTYLINQGDKHSIKHFAAPFVRQFGMDFPESVGDYGLPGGVMKVRDWGAGHKYPPVDFLMAELSSAAG